MKEIAKRAKDVKASEINEFFNLLLEDKSAISLCVGQPNFNTPQHIEEAAIESIRNGKNFYTSDYGLPELRHEISKYLKRKYNLNYTNEEVLVTIGASEAIDLAIRTLIEEDDEVILFDPVYDAYTPLVRLSGGKDVHVLLKEENDFKIDVKDVESKITSKTKAVIINFPNNPTGATMTKEELEPLAKLCIKHDLYLISDEIYSELSYETKHESICEIEGMKERTILINGFSKAYAMTGFRLGYLCANLNLILQMKKIHAFGVVSCPSASQYAGIEALKNGDSDIELMKEDYNKRREFTYSKIKALNIPCYKGTGAFYFFPSIKEFNMTSFEFAKKLLTEKHVAIIPGSAFGDNYKYNVRISYTSSCKDIEEAFKRINEFVLELRKEHTL